MCIEVTFRFCFLIESSEFQDISGIRQIGDGKDAKISVSSSDSIPELEQALANLSQEGMEERRKRMFRLVTSIFYDFLGSHDRSIKVGAPKGGNTYVSGNILFIAPSQKESWSQKLHEFIIFYELP